jgi:phospholipase C
MQGADRRPDEPRRKISRRSLLRSSMAIGAAGALTKGLGARQGHIIESASSTGAAAGATLADVEHVVIVIQENRSFDHYFGTMSAVRGFADPHALSHVVDGTRYTVFDQFGYQPGRGVSASGFLQPFRLIDDPPMDDGFTTNDITHDWAPQHVSWNDGRMDQFVKAHVAADGAANGFLTMGYFTRSELPFYYALADAFTICDRYHCSVLGPTDPNRSMAMTGGIGADGAHGQPILETYVQNRVEQFATRSWETMPERLSEAGVSWKIYQDPTSLFLFNVLPYFKQYAFPASAAQARLAQQAFTPQYPTDFEADVADGSLPKVSWLIPPAVACEHPAAPPPYGEWFVSQVLETLVSNPEVWERTVMFVTYDENGGWFDHVPPVTPGPTLGDLSEVPNGAEFEGEYVTLGTLPEDAKGIRGPVGLGFRVPCLVVSPFSRGGNVSSEVFDHTSLLRFLERRFAVEVPNLSSWRRSVTGDMTCTLPLLSSPDLSTPRLPATSLTDPKVLEQSVVNSILGTESQGQDYPPPSSNSGVPPQEQSPPRRQL